jgi:multiple antibiotic resistance protein
MLDELVKFFVVLLVVVEPLSLLPVLAGLTEGADDSYRRRMSCKAVGIAAAVCLVFAAGGSALLAILGISVHAFKVGGGILLFLLAVEMVFARPSGARSITPGEDAEAHHRGDISVFPLAFPLIAGPGALAVILLAFAGVPPASLQFAAQVVVILLVLTITLALMLATGPVMRVVGVTGGAVLGRLLGVLLAALAAQFVMDGIRGAMAA